MAADYFDPNFPSISAPASRFFVITPNDSTELAARLRAIYVGVGGDVALWNAIDGAVTFKNVGTGQLLDVRADRVYATGTTATNLVGLY